MPSQSSSWFLSAHMHMRRASSIVFATITRAPTASRLSRSEPTPGQCNPVSCLCLDSNHCNARSRASQYERPIFLFACRHRAAIIASWLRRGSLLARCLLSRKSASSIVCSEVFQFLKVGAFCLFARLQVCSFTSNQVAFAERQRPIDWLNRTVGTVCN